MVDEARLLRMLGGDRSALIEFAHALRLDLSQRLQHLQTAGQTQDKALARTHTHALKGALASSAMETAAAITKALEAAASQDNWPYYLRALALLEQEAKAIDHALESLVNPPD